MAPGGAGAGIADEVAVDVAARAANGLGDDADRTIALGDDVAGLAVVDVAGWCVPMVCSSTPCEPVAAGLDRSGQVERDRPRRAAAANRR